MTTHKTAEQQALERATEIAQPIIRSMWTCSRGALRDLLRDLWLEGFRSAQEQNKIHEGDITPEELLEVELESERARAAGLIRAVEFLERGDWPDCDRAWAEKALAQLWAALAEYRGSK